MLNWGQLKRSSSDIKGRLKAAPSGVFMNVGDEPLYVVIPARYRNIGLLNNHEGYTEAYSFFMIATASHYAVYLGSSMTRLTIAPMQLAKVEDSEYIIYTYMPGDIVIPTSNIVQDSALIYNILNELFVLGNIPFFASYDDMGRTLDHTKEYTGSSIGDMTKVGELMAAICAHDPKDTGTHYRHVLSGNKPVYYGMSQVQADSLSPFAKVMGSYANPAILSSILDDKVYEASKIETLLRTN